jgi:hypothetical protein
MYNYIGDDVHIMPGDELFVTTVVRNTLTRGEWLPVQITWYGWTRRYFEMRLQDMGMPGTIFIRRKAY